MAGSSTNLLFGEGLETISSLTESGSVNESPDFASSFTETFSELQTEQPEAQSCTECSKTFKTSRWLQRHFSKHNKNNFHTLDYEIILPKSN